MRSARHWQLSRRLFVLVVIGVHRERQSELSKIVDASDASPGFFGLAKSRQEHTRKNGDNRNHDQQFD